MNTNDSAVRKAEPAWFKSSYSGSGGGACIEVANGTDTILVRDSKDAAGPVPVRLTLVAGGKSIETEVSLDGNGQPR